MTTRVCLCILDGCAYALYRQMGVRMHSLGRGLCISSPDIIMKEREREREREKERDDESTASA